MRSGYTTDYAQRADPGTGAHAAAAAPDTTSGCKRSINSAAVWAGCTGVLLGPGHSRRLHVWRPGGLGGPPIFPACHTRHRCSSNPQPLRAPAVRRTGLLRRGRASPGSTRRPLGRDVDAQDQRGLVRRSIVPRRVVDVRLQKTDGFHRSSQEPRVIMESYHRTAAEANREVYKVLPAVGDGNSDVFGDFGEITKRTR